MNKRERKRETTTEWKKSDGIRKKGQRHTKTHNRITVNGKKWTKKRKKTKRKKNKNNNKNTVCIIWASNASVWYVRSTGCAFPCLFIILSSAFYLVFVCGVISLTHQAPALFSFFLSFRLLLLLLFLSASTCC